MRRALLCSCLTLALATTACQDQKTEPTSPSAGAGPELKQQPLAPLRRDRLRLPATLRMSDRRLADPARRAINPGDYVCPASTPATDWFLTEVFEFINREPALFQILYVTNFADLIPQYEALFFETTATPQYFGYTGEYTQVLTKTERDVKRFWDIYSRDIQLIGFHGTVLQDLDRTAATYEILFGESHAAALSRATAVRNALLQSEVLDGGNHPLFSFNAFAISTTNGSIPDKIVVGDGVLEGYAAIGFGDVAPQAIYAHEFGHHIQYENGYFDDPFATTGDAAEQTRYTELMADAFSAYYLTHKRGAAMNRKRVEQFLQVFFNTGDCAFADPGHHGTPNQRMAAARFGFAIAAQAQKQGHILTSEQFHALFVAAYPGLIAPDAT
jgi:hypothetical protein